MGGGPPGFPQGFSCLVVLWILLAASRFRLQDFHPLWLAFPKPFGYQSAMLNAVRNPEEPGPSVWPLSRSLAATKEIEFSFSSYCYLDVSVHSVPFHTLWIHAWILEVCSSRFPHSEISGSMAVCASPKLIAAYHVFHRLLVPRHSPYALSCLTSLVEFSFDALHDATTYLLANVRASCNQREIRFCCFSNKNLPF